MEDTTKTHSESSDHTEANSVKSEDFIIEGENEPYLGPSWAVLMLVLYALKSIFPAHTYSFFWWFQIYIVAIVLGVTIFTLIKRYKYFNLK